MPPAYWSGTLDDLVLYVVSGESGQEPTPWPVEFDLEIAPKADGIDLNPTLSFGKAGDIIALNLNAAMQDPVAAGTSDGHSERTTLQLSGFPDGEKVVFYVNGVELDADRVSFAGGTHTITGLTQVELDGLGFLHLGTGGVKTVGITAWTNEVNTATGAIEGAASEAKVTSVTINVSDKLTTNGNDHLLWTGSPIDGRDGTDTIQLRYGESVSGSDLADKLDNIEIIDLRVQGANSITGLTADHVAAITGGGNNLQIHAGVGDRIVLVGFAGAGGTYTATDDSGITVTTGTGVTVELQAADSTDGLDGTESSTMALSLLDPENEQSTDPDSEESLLADDIELQLEPDDVEDDLEVSSEQAADEGDEGDEESTSENDAAPVDEDEVDAEGEASAPGTGYVLDMTSDDSILYFAEGEEVTTDLGDEDTDPVEGELDDVIGLGDVLDLSADDTLLYFGGLDEAPAELPDGTGEPDYADADPVAGAALGGVAVDLNLASTMSSNSIVID